MAENKPNSLREAIALLEKNSGELVRVARPVDVKLELAGVYKKYAGGVPSPPPTQVGPAVLFENAKGYEMPVVAGILGSRERASLFLGAPKERLGFAVSNVINKPVPPRLVSQAASQEIVISENINLAQKLPIPTFTKLDAGPYLLMGLAHATDPETGTSDVTFHRMCVQSPDTMTVMMSPTKHIRKMFLKAQSKGKPLPVSINIGLDPYSTLAAAFNPPTTNEGADELHIAGAMKGSPIELVKCKTIDAQALANAEIVLECEIQPGVRVAEDSASRSGLALAEFAGYYGTPHECPVVKVKAITHRREPIFQTLVIPGEEINVMQGVTTEAGIFDLARRADMGNLVNVHCPPSGAGKLSAILQVKNESEHQDGTQRQLALIAFASFFEIKMVTLVDEDVNIWDPNDVLWALTTRFQAKTDIAVIDEVRSHPGDPSQSPGFSSNVRLPGVGSKAIFDCTVPFGQKAKFRRPIYYEGSES